MSCRLQPVVTTGPLGEVVELRSVPLPLEWNGMQPTTNGIQLKEEL